MGLCGWPVEEQDKDKDKDKDKDRGVGGVEGHQRFNSAGVWRGCAAGQVKLPALVYHVCVSPLFSIQLAAKKRGASQKENRVYPQ